MSAARREESAMKQRRINAALTIAALALTVLPILTILPLASTAAPRLEQQPPELLTGLNSTEATESGALSAASVVQSPGTTTCVSVASDETKANGDSSDPWISVQNYTTSSTPALSGDNLAGIVLADDGRAILPIQGTNTINILSADRSSVDTITVPSEPYGLGSSLGGNNFAYRNHKIFYTTAGGQKVYVYDESTQQFRQIAERRNYYWGMDLNDKWIVQPAVNPSGFGVGVDIYNYSDDINAIGLAKRLTSNLSGCDGTTCVTLDSGMVAAGSDPTNMYPSKAYVVEDLVYFIRGTYWGGQPDGGFYKVNLTTNTVMIYTSANVSGLDSSVPIDLHYDNSMGNIYFSKYGTPPGLFKVSSDLLSASLFKPNSRLFLWDSTTQYLLTSDITNNGVGNPTVLSNVRVIEKSTGQEWVYSSASSIPILSTQVVAVAYRSGTDELYVATRKGLSVLSPGEGPPTPFLDLPFDYGDSVPAFVQALRDTDDGGRVNSWFDHKYPDGFKNQQLVLYDGRARTKNLYNPSLGCYEGRCYDGHNGIDFARLSGDPQNLPIYPAASGVITEIATACTDSCRYGSCSACGAYGNYVIVDHQNEYFTRYAHLQAVEVSQGQMVTTNDILGIMGSTGHTFLGTHLHFGVYRDNGNGQWDGESVDKPVDPYGWKGVEADPWVTDLQGPTSYYLWIHEMSTQDTVSGNQGATMTDITGHVQVTIPPGAFSGQATLELSPVREAEPSAQLRSTGRSFWLRLLEWLLEGGGLQSATALQSTTQFTLTKPITLTVIYTDTDVLHLDESQLALHRWDEEQETWQPMTTTVDSDNHVVIAQTENLGDFDLQSPLLCATDDLEPDDGYAAARWVWPNDWPLARCLDIPQDSDWSRFDAIQGVTYTISTQNLAAGADTVLNLYDVDALTLLANNDDADGGPASELVWTAPYTGTFFVETVSAPDGTTDCSATYELTT
ncbi:MAG: M23 family metallopeptidase, partial [Chloroflexi bacterium]|nr:M23 family metallopeptidase [Chloroflexota bacterium]